MEHNQTDFDRLLAGQVASDDPALGRVAAFLDKVQASQKMPDVQSLADPHLRLMRQATKLETTESHHPHQSRMARRSRRIFIGAVAGILAGITAGVGVAAASAYQGSPWLDWLPWNSPSTTGASSSSWMTPGGSQSNGQAPTSYPGTPAATGQAPTTVPPTASAPPQATVPAADPSKSDKRVADPSKGVIPSATTRGKSSAAPGHTKTATPPAAKPTKKQTSEATDKASKAPKG